MPWFYTEMVQWHVLLAWCSVALFFTRGLLFQLGTRHSRFEGATSYAENAVYANVTQQF